MKAEQHPDSGETESQRAQTLRIKRDAGIALLILGYVGAAYYFPLAFLSIIGFLWTVADGYAELTDPSEIGKLIGITSPFLICLIFVVLIHLWRWRIKREERMAGFRRSKR